MSIDFLRLICEQSSLLRDLRNAKDRRLCDDYQYLRNGILMFKINHWCILKLIQLEEDDEIKDEKHREELKSMKLQEKLSNSLTSLEIFLSNNQNVLSIQKNCVDDTLKVWNDLAELKFDDEKNNQELDRIHQCIFGHIFSVRSSSFFFSFVSF